MTHKEAIALLLSKGKQTYGSKKDLAKEIGISAPYLSQIIHGERQLSRRILGYLHLKKIKPDLYEGVE